jgi:exopolyphosphatase/guanosine-5'-triphosphate,3'-diphosphate pyrophosphatase
MRLGIIDLGTNSVRFDVHEIREGGEVKLLHREKLMVRLGQGVFVSAKLDPAAKQRTLHAMQSFKRTAAELGVSRMTAFGTSALRESSDGAAFVKQIVRKTGIDLRVIPGEEEARLIAIGILKNEKQTKGKFALIDIGGGSTEISICKGKKVLYSHSFELGTARLHQVFLKSSPPIQTPGEGTAVKRLRKHIREALQSVLKPGRWPKVPRAIGSSGTIRAIDKLESLKTRKKKPQKGFTRTNLEKWVESIEPMTTTEILAIPGMEAKRVDMFLAGAVLLDEILKELKIKRVHSSDFSLRDGILEEERQRVLSGVTLTRRRQSLRINTEELRKKALRLGAHAQHLDQVQKISLQIFDATQRLHRLTKEWREVLSGAAYVHDIGEAINPVDHGLHGSYVIQEAHFPGMDERTESIVKALVQFHSGGRPNRDNVQFWSQADDRKGFITLLAILRVADALDRGHRQPIEVSCVRLDRKHLRLIVDFRGAMELEVLRLEQKRGLFEEVFGKLVTLERASSIRGGR